MNRIRQKRLAVGLMLGLAATAGATVITADGNFGAETNGVDVSANWAPHGWYSAGDAASQSPFTNLFANNGMGARVAGGGYIVGYTSPLVMITTGMLYLNVDFKYTVVDTPNPNAIFGFDVTKDADGSKRALSIAVTKDTIYAESSAGLGAALLAPVVGTWYNVQLALDVAAGSYSGTITPYGAGSIAIASRNFVTSNGINCVFTNNGPTGVAAGNPDYSVDNFALSIPEPASLGLLALGGLLLARRRRGAEPLVTVRRLQNSGKAEANVEC